MIMNIKWENSVWFFDLDDTLIDTAGANEKAAEGIRQYFARQIGDDVAQRIKERYIALFSLLLAGYRVKTEDGWGAIEGGKAAYGNLLAKINELQPSVIQEHGHAKKWSREILVKIAADECGAILSPEQVEAAGKAYWDALAEQVTVLPGASELLTAIAAHGRPAYIITSSDGRLQMQEDGSFVYDPKHSEACKSSRVEKMRNKGLQFNDFRIGDPEDKPHIDFFQKIITVAEEQNGKLDPSNCLMFGDSYGGDLETPQKKLGFGLVVHVDHKAHETSEEADRLVVTKDLTDFLMWFESKQ